MRSPRGKGRGVEVKVLVISGGITAPFSRPIAPGIPRQGQFIFQPGYDLPERKNPFARNNNIYKGRIKILGHDSGMVASHHGDDFRVLRLDLLEKSFHRVYVDGI